IKERRATISQDPDTIAMRPGTRTAFNNMYLAGDWTDTGLPATIEGAVLSGKRAARACEQT
ncbi:MAG: FAD-dependent oxidoreductase, partial [bacterium]|nr:FAD-dependent oxidoreductase [bacterium]